jgi:hypothetical protein
MEFDIKVVEKRSTQVKVDANNLSEAISAVMDEYRDGKISLHDPDDIESYVQFRDMKNPNSLWRRPID